MTRNFTVHNIDQRTPEWMKLRAGRVTGTCAAKFLAKGKGSAESVQRRDLRMRLCLERLTGVPQEDSHTNHHMERGILKEPDAFAAYEAATGFLVSRTGFLAHTELSIGCSLDGDIDEFTGIVELKCPAAATHFEYLRDWHKGKTALDGIPENYLRQITHELLVTGAEWCDFASFNDTFPSALQLVIWRVRREDVDLAAYQLALTLFLKEVDALMVEVQAMQQKAQAA